MPSKSCTYCQTFPLSIASRHALTGWTKLAHLGDGGTEVSGCVSAVRQEDKEGKRAGRRTETGGRKGREGRKAETGRRERAEQRGRREEAARQTRQQADNGEVEKTEI